MLSIVSQALDLELREQRLVRAAWGFARQHLAAQRELPLLPTASMVAVELRLQNLSLPLERIAELCRALGLALAGQTAEPDAETRECVAARLPRR